jgi:aminopeptidase YwaD
MPKPCYHTLFLIIATWGAVFTPVNLSAQSRTQALQDLHDLCSPRMAGRGYQDSGHVHAAHFIAQRFSNLKLTPFRKFSENLLAYYQPFFLDVNLCDSISLMIGNQNLIPGADFILHPASGSTQGTFPFLNIGFGMGEDWEGNKIKGKAVKVRLGYPPDYRNDEITKKTFEAQSLPAFKYEMADVHAPALLFVEKNKLTASLSTQAYPFAAIDILPGRIPKGTRKISACIQMRQQKVQTQNVIGSIPGKKYPDSLIIFCAHYDHLGKQGSAIFTGANDNASGVAFLLALASHYAKPENHSDYTLMFIAFGAEEAGLKGSLHFVSHLLPEIKDKIKFVLNFDLMGNGDQGITLVAANLYPEHARIIQAQMEADTILTELRDNAPNSDHYPFTRINVPALFLYTKGGPPHYHDVMDTPDQVQFPIWDALFQGITKAVEHMP